MSDEIERSFTDPLQMRGPTSFLDVFVTQQRQAADIKSLQLAIKALEDERVANHFTAKDLVLYMFGAVAAIGGILTGLFFLIGSVVNPVNADLATFKTSTSERFMAQGEALRNIRQQIFDLQKTVSDDKLDAAKITARLDAILRDGWK